MTMPNNELIIQAPRQGISQSPHTGFADVRNLDITSIPGIARLNKKLSTVTDSPATRINWFVRNPTTPTEFFALGNTGIVYTSTNSGQSFSTLSGNTLGSLAHGNGLAIWKDYLFVARDTLIDVYNLTGITCTITIAVPGIITKTAHGLVADDTIIFSTTGALPTGLTAGTVYYVNTVYDADQFSVATSTSGSDITTSGTQSGVHTYKAWDLAWQTITSDVDWHSMLPSKLDDKLYGGAGRNVFTIKELTTFLPGTAATFTWTSAALALPSPYRIKCLEELGNSLMIGTWQGTSEFDYPIADIFTWDGTATTFGQPIVLKDFGVHAMLNTGNSLIVLAGVKGSIYRCDGANVYLIGKLPIEVTGTIFIKWFPGAICNYKDKVFFGASGSGTLAGMGVYSLQQTGQGNILNLEHLNRNLTDGSAAQVIIGALIPRTDNLLLVGYQSDTTSEVNITDTNSYLYSTDYSGYFESPLYVVGSLKKDRIFTELEFQFAKELATGEGIRIKYRVNLTDSFTTLGTYSFSTLGAVISHYEPANIPACELLQIRVELLGTSTTTPQFKSLTLR